MAPGALADPRERQQGDQSLWRLWLLTLRGGINHTLADTKVKDKEGEPDRDPTDEERKGWRILLALSWLSVESRLGVPETYIIATGEDAAEERNGKVIAALEEILKKRDLRKTKLVSGRRIVRLP